MSVMGGQPRTAGGGYEFDDQQNGVIGGVASAMKFVGIAQMILGSLSLLGALMALLGRLNWWAPPALARWHARWGITDEPLEENAYAS